jgi:hypothetical protein
MELVLNLGWVLLATLLFCVWLRSASPTSANRRLQLISLAILILILFPVVSVTDDLQTAQYPAIVDTSQRRDHVCSIPHSIFPAVVALPPPVFAGICYGILRTAAPASLPAPLGDYPALAPIQIRPPPAA